MIVGTEFEGDSTRIGWVQHDCYGDPLRVIVSFAIAKHRRAESVIGIHNEFSDKRDRLGRFDHRTLQWFHDQIAAAFRLQYCVEADLFTYPVDRSHTDEEIVKFWLEFLTKELDRIFEYSLALPRWILIAAIYPNPDKRGIEAEDELMYLTRTLYPDLKSSKI